MILKPDDHPALFPGKMQKLYALDHGHRVSILMLLLLLFCYVLNDQLQLWSWSVS